MASRPNQKGPWDPAPQPHLASCLVSCVVGTHAEWPCPGDSRTLLPPLLPQQQPQGSSGVSEKQFHLPGWKTARVLVLRRLCLPRSSSELGRAQGTVALWSQVRRPKDTKPDSVFVAVRDVCGMCAAYADMSPNKGERELAGPAQATPSPLFLCHLAGLLHCSGAESPISQQQ